MRLKDTQMWWSANRTKEINKKQSLYNHKKSFEKRKMPCSNCNKIFSKAPYWNKIAPGQSCIEGRFKMGVSNKGFCLNFPKIKQIYRGFCSLPICVIYMDLKRIPSVKGGIFWNFKLCSK